MRNPFSISPDPQFLYLTQSLRAILDKVRFVLDERQGLTVIYGEVGHGKSTVLRHLYSEYAAREDCRVAFLPNPNYNTDLALLKAICGEFDLPRRRSMLDQEHELRAFLLEAFGDDKNCVVFIDESQRLTGKVLEIIRTLLNFETDSAKLIQIVLTGQLELRDRLRDPSKKALRSRIFLSSTLDPLSLAETGEMIGFRCERAGVANPFGSEAIETVYLRSGGVPRQILKLCGSAWHIAKLNDLASVPVDLIDDVVPDTEPDPALAAGASL
jgi:type II secretory pathway predicted ATPase ExeA